MRASAQRDTFVTQDSAYLSTHSNSYSPSNQYPTSNTYPPVRVITDYIPPYQPNPGQQLTYYRYPAFQAYTQCVPCERACNTQCYLCYQYCVPGCTCESGFVRDTVTNECVPRFRCPWLYQGRGRYAIYGQGGDGFRT
ncbi:hypothetical protein Aduo_011377 [Ancylostoma duodenale]